MNRPERSTGQQWNPDLYGKFGSFVPKMGEALLALLEPKAGERVLDLGCGDGALSTKIAASGALVVGVDASAQMISAAIRRGIQARQLDAHEMDYENEFDAVFSNAALHWMKDPDRVIAGVARALKHGGRFVGEMGGYGNVAAIMVATLATLKHRGVDGRGAVPYFPAVDEYRTRLERGGFMVDYIQLIPRPTPLPNGMPAWLDTFGNHFFSLLAPDERAAARDEVVELLRPLLCDWKGNWIADYVRLRFAAKLC
jgi:trans-aconitate methyltransferase